MSKTGELRKFFKSNAKQLLYSNWVSHIAAFFCIALCFVGLLQVGNAITDILIINFADDYNKFRIIYSVVKGGTFAFTILMTVPLLYGCSVFEFNAVNTSKAELSDIFYAFSSVEKYRRSFLLFFALLWRFLIVFSIPVFACAELYLYKYKMHTFILSETVISGYDLTYTVAALFIIISFIISTMIFSRFFTAVYITIDREDTPVSKCFFTARICNYGYTSVFSSVIISNFFLIIISILSFGVLFFIYTIPILMLTQFSAASYVYKKELTTQKITQNILSEKPNII